MKTKTTGEIKCAKHPAADHDHVHCAGCGKPVTGPHQASASKKQPWARECPCGVITWYEVDQLLFTLTITPNRNEPAIVIDAWDGGPDTRWPSHHRIVAQVRQGDAIIFPRGAIYCGVPKHTPLDGNDAKELVMACVAMKPGDTDDEYFASYTVDQLAWARKYGEEISCEREARYCDENGNVKK